MMVQEERLDPKDVFKIKERLYDDTVPCNIYGLIKQMLGDIETIKVYLDL